MSGEMIMCRACGHFVAAVEKDGMLRPIKDTCPECDGTVFKDVRSDTIVRSDDS